VALSTADTNKWSILLDQRFQVPTPKKTSPKYERTGPIRQRQRRLSDIQAEQMACRYRQGATVYELAIEFNIDRRTVSDRLKKAGVRMRLQPPPEEMIDEMVRLYASGLSFATIGKQLCASPRTVSHYVQRRGVQIRNAHKSLD
jgi:DNA-binding CsgD family transcriptional regulator